MLMLSVEKLKTLYLPWETHSMRKSLKKKVMQRSENKVAVGLKITKSHLGSGNPKRRREGKKTLCGLFTFSSY